MVASTKSSANSAAVLDQSCTANASSARALSKSFEDILILGEI
jgi:hypothetical protein